MQFEGFILFGGGDFAVEVATYIADLAHFDELSVRPGEQSRYCVCDVISQAPARRDEFKEIQGREPQFHSNIDTVHNITKKKIVVCIGDPVARHRVFTELKTSLAGVRFGTIIHPKAYVAGTAKIEAGTVISPFGFVGPFASVGANCVINVAAIVGHDVVLGTSTILSPGADINGHASTGDAAFLGAGAIINPKAGLGSFSKLSAGSVLNTQTGDGFLMHGNPAKGRQMVKLS